jgi:hypothetical protein
MWYGARQWRVSSPLTEIDDDDEPTMDDPVCLGNGLFLLSSFFSRRRKGKGIPPKITAERSSPPWTVDDQQ